MTDQASNSVLAALSIKLVTAVFGFTGAMVSLAFGRQVTRAQALVSVAVGLTTALAVTPLVQAMLHLSDSLLGGIAFLIGLTAMGVLPVVMHAAPGLFARWVARTQNQPTQGEGDAK
ncbi:hypothetical protein [Dyella amyloliquefaciens]|uniref:hypothetical protein n=1 Tax=Dyella amyloliquefaciens TaxID=1770545 RepID=UPI00102E7659|nr:hypothetical protein [Dyella amyloliquefaciens]